MMVRGIGKPGEGHPEAPGDFKLVQTEWIGPIQQANEGRDVEIGIRFNTGKTSQYADIFRGDADLFIRLSKRSRAGVFPPVLSCPPEKKPGRCDGRVVQFAA